MVRAAFCRSPDTRPVHGTAPGHGRRTLCALTLDWQQELPVHWHS
jgi:hypothetical protein